MIQRLLLSLLIVTATTACSMKDRSSLVGLNVTLPGQHSNQSSSSSALFESFGFGGLTQRVFNPTQTNSCYALNITGDGIPIDHHFGCTLPSQGMGMLAGMIPTTGGTIIANVPAGASRTIQLVGVTSEVGCEDFSDLFATAGGTNGLTNTPILLGSTTIDLFSDASVNITADYSSTTQLFQDCAGPGGNGQPTLAFNSIGQSNYVMQTILPVPSGGEFPTPTPGYCASVEVDANNGVGNGVSFVPAATNVTDGTVKFYTDASCSTQLTGPISMTSNHQNVYLQATGAIGSTFSLQVTSPSAGVGWQTPSTSFKVVTNRLQIQTPGPSTGTWAEAGDSCAQVSFTQTTNNSNSPTVLGNGNYTVTFFNNANDGSANSVLPSIKVFTSETDCENGSGSTYLTPTPNSNGSFSYTISNAQMCTASQCSVYVSDSQPESLSPQIYSSSGYYQPAVSGMSFVPFVVDMSVANTIVTPQCGIGGQCAFKIGFLSGQDSITAVQVSGQPCTSFSVAGNQITCMAPPSPSGGVESLPINLVVSNGMVIASGLYVNYINFASGDGTAAYPYQIATADQFMTINSVSSTRPNSVFMQTAALDFTGVTLTGAASAYNNSIYGTYNGQNFAISNTQYPLFTNCNNSTISNIQLENVSINTPTSEDVGALCQDANNSNFDTIIATSGAINASFTAENNYNSVGGLFGNIGTGMITNSISRLQVSSGATYVGGLIGMTLGTHVSNSWATGVVATSGSYSSNVGGLVGGAQTNSQFTHVFATGAVTGSPGMYTGGLLGYASATSVSLSFATGNVATGMFVGGMIGGTNGATGISESFSLGNVTADTAAGYAGGFIGQALSSGTSISNSYSRAITIAGQTLGSLIGSNNNATITNSGAYTTTSGTTSTPGAATITNLTTTTGYGISASDVASNWELQTMVNLMVLNWACIGAARLDDGFTCPP